MRRSRQFLVGLEALFSSQGATPHNNLLPDGEVLCLFVFIALFRIALAYHDIMSTYTRDDPKYASSSYT